MDDLETNPVDIRVQLRVRQFDIPPVRDCLVIGHKSPVGCVALLKSLALLHGEPFDELQPKDSLVSNILVRRNVLKKMSGDKLIGLVLKRVKPLMGEEEVLQIDVNVEIELEERA